MKTICPSCGSEDIILIEYDMLHPDHYDGVSEIRCNLCLTRWGRWSNKILEGDEYEKDGKERDEDIRTT